jgi:hypothetical protein
VKGYLVKRMPKGLVFECVQCDFVISLAKEFPQAKEPARRTLAASWMNDHIRTTHPIVHSKQLNNHGIK